MHLPKYVAGLEKVVLVVVVVVVVVVLLLLLLWLSALMLQLVC